MKLIKSLSLIIILIFSFNTIKAQEITPGVLKTLDNKSVNIKDYLGKGKPVIISFWASWCGACKEELDAIHELYEEWKELYNVEVIAITIDNARGLRKVPGIVASKGWEFTVLSDENEIFKNSLNFQAVPQSFLIDSKGKVVYSHSAYVSGDEYEMEDELKKLKK